MKKKKLAILEPAIAYAELLVRFLRDKKDQIFDIRVFTQETALNEFMEQEKVDVLLASELSSYEQYKDKVGVLMLLSAGAFVKEQECYPCIYKFQSAQEILRQVHEEYIKNSEEAEVSYLPRQDRLCKQIGIFSPYGGTGKTTLSVVLGHFLGEKKKVLVVNLEAFPKEYSFLPDGKKEGVSDFIYYMKEDGRRAGEKLESLVSSVGNMDYLKGVSHYLDLERMDEKDIRCFARTLREKSTYDVIIYDISFMGKGMFALLEECQRIYEPSFKKSRVKDWLEGISPEEQATIKKKRCRVYLPWEENLEGSIMYMSSGKLGTFVEKLWKGETQYGKNKETHSRYGVTTDFYGRKSVG